MHVYFCSHSFVLTPTSALDMFYVQISSFYVYILYLKNRLHYIDGFPALGAKSTYFYDIFHFLYRLIQNSMLFRMELKIRWFV